MTPIVQRTLVVTAVLLVSATARAEHAALSVAEANQAATRYAGQVKSCYFRHALVEPAAAGFVRIDLQVRSAGTVDRVRVVAPGIARRAFERCIVGRALTWRFPAARQPTEVRMPFRFHIPVRLRTAAARRQ
jgi:TonB family protein